MSPLVAPKVCLTECPLGPYVRQSYRVYRAWRNKVISLYEPIREEQESHKGRS